jgi:hypothetical protein
MSTQLVLYPQHHNGYSANFTAASNQFVVDGIDFLNINVSDSQDLTGGTIAGVLTLLPPNIVNTWYRFRTATSGTPALPTGTISSGMGSLVLNTVPTYSLSGVYQRLANLVVGGVYTFTINTTPLLSGGSFQLKVFNGVTLAQYSQVTFDASIYIQGTDTFVAQTPEDIMMVTYYNTLDDDLTITDISITGTGTGPSGVYRELQDGQVICDLYQDEDIPLTLSIDEFKNVAEQVKSYSKDFNLPATKRNNRIFNNMFEITRTDDGLIFNPQVITKCVLKQDGFILFDGYLRMIDIKDKEGEISYNVNLYSEVIALADILKDRTFAALEFEELAHSYTISNIKNSWESTGAGDGLLLTNPLPTTSLAYDAVTGVNNTQVLKYPFIDWNHQLALQGGLNLLKLEVGFRPCIQVKYLIDKIFQATEDFTYTSDFFDATVATHGFDFDNLYMDFNWGSSSNGAADLFMDFNQRAFDNSAGTFELTSLAWKPLPLNISVLGNSSYWDAALHRFTSPSHSLTFTGVFLIKVNNIDTGPGLPTHNVALRIARYDQFGNFIEQFGFADQNVGFASSVSILGSFTTELDVGDYIQAEFKCPSDDKLRLDTDTFFNMAWNNTASSAVALLDVIRGELGQWDFLKGIMTMFNLVSTADKDNPNNILIEPYNDIFINITNGGAGNVTLAARSIQHDWTDKVDVSEMELNPLTDLDKNTIFKFVEDDDDYPFQVFKSANSGHLYGSRNYDASTSSSGLNTLFTGTEEIVAEPFAASVIAPLESAYMDFVVPRIYARDEDGLCESFENSPRILYNNGIKTLATPSFSSYSVPTQNGEAGETLDHFLQFSHLSEIPSVSATSKDFVFTSFQLTSVDVGIPPLDNLFTTYWLPYLTELYHADTRTMNLKVNLNPADIATFKFNDTVMIKNRSFRVNKIEYKPNSLAKVEFILLP